MSGGSPRLPDGFVVRLEQRTRRLVRSDGGLALLGLSPGRVLHLSPTARRLLAGTELVVSDAVSAALARRLLDAGVAHPVPEAVSALESITALGRMGLPEDVADVVGFLAGPQGRWVTGQTIDVSGGTYLGPLMPG